MARSVIQGTIIRNQPAFRPRPDTMLGYHRFSNGDYDAFVKLGALEAIAAWAREAFPNEMIGYLVGRPFRDGKGVYALVTEAILAESARCGPGRVETSLDDEQRLLTTIQADHPLAERLGWFHSHPYHLPNYSTTDRENQRFWSEPFQLGLLAYLDGHNSVSIVAFRGPESEAIHPPYTRSENTYSNHERTFRPMVRTENSEATPKTAEPIEHRKERRPSLPLLTLVLGIVWPIVYLIGVGMIAQAIRASREHSAPTVIVAQDGEPPVDPSSKAASVKAATAETSKKASPKQPVTQPAQKRHEPDTDDW